VKVSLGNGSFICFLKPEYEPSFPMRIMVKYIVSYTVLFNKRFHLCVHFLHILAALMTYR